MGEQLYAKVRNVGAARIFDGRARRVESKGRKVKCVWLHVYPPWAFFLGDGDSRRQFVLDDWNAEGCIHGVTVVPVIVVHKAYVYARLELVEIGLLWNDAKHTAHRTGTIKRALWTFEDLNALQAGSSDNRCPEH